jgi:hypothetical protein
MLESAAMMAADIKAAQRAYSIAVAPPLSKA